MKKIGILMALMLVVIVFCGKKSEIDKILPTGGKKAAQTKEVIQQNSDSYNKNIKIYNRIWTVTIKIQKYITDYWKLIKNFYIILKIQELKRHSKNLFRK